MRSLKVLVYSSLHLVQYHKPQVTPWHPHEVPLVILEVTPRSEVVTLREKAERLDVYPRVRCAAAEAAILRSTNP